MKSGYWRHRLLCHLNPLCVVVLVTMFAAARGAFASDARAQEKLTLLLPQLRIENLSEYPQHDITAQTLRADALDVLGSYQQRISMESLQDICSRITGRYRAAGFVFTRAYIPAQRSDDGVVVIRLLEGWLSEVDVYDNTDYRDAVLLEPFESLRGQVLYSPDVEEALAIVNDMPGVDAFGFFSIGDEVGSTRINLRIKRERRWSAALRADNYGSPLTGEIRSSANAEWFNPAGVADVLRVGVLHSFDPENASFGYASYIVPVISPFNHVGVEVSADQYDLGRRGSPTYDNFRISGESQTLRSYFHRLLKKRNGKEMSWQLDARYVESQSKSDVFRDVAEINHEQSAWIVDWSWQQSARYRKSGYWWQLQTGPGTGRYGDGEPAQQSGDFYFYSLSAAFGGPIKWFGASGTHHWYAQLDGQYSADLLPATQQYSLTGATRARGFEAGVFVGDSAESLRLAWQPPMSAVLPWWRHKAWISAVALEVFAEHAYGVQRAPVADASDAWGRVADVGVALDYEWQDALSLSMSVAKAVYHRDSYEYQSISTSRVYVSAAWHFN